MVFPVWTRRPADEVLHRGEGRRAVRAGADPGVGVGVGGVQRDAERVHARGGELRDHVAPLPEARQAVGVDAHAGDAGRLEPLDNQRVLRRDVVRVNF